MQIPLLLFVLGHNYLGSISVLQVDSLLYLNEYPLFYNKLNIFKNLTLVALWQVSDDTTRHVKHPGPLWSLLNLMCTWLPIPLFCTDCWGHRPLAAFLESSPPGSEHWHRPLLPQCNYCYYHAFPSLVLSLSYFPQSCKAPVEARTIP